MQVSLRKAEIVDNQFTFEQDGKKITLDNDLLFDAYYFYEHLVNREEVVFMLKYGDLSYDSLYEFCPEKMQLFEDDSKLKSVTFNDQKLVDILTDRMESFLYSEYNGIDGEPGYDCVSYFSTCSDFDRDEFADLIIARGKELEKILKQNDFVRFTLVYEDDPTVMNGFNFDKARESGMSEEDIKLAQHSWGITVCEVDRKWLKEKYESNTKVFERNFSFTTSEELEGFENENLKVDVSRYDPRDLYEHRDQLKGKKDEILGEFVMFATTDPNLSAETVMLNGKTLEETLGVAQTRSRGR